MAASLDLDLWLRTLTQVDAAWVHFSVPLWDREYGGMKNERLASAKGNYLTVSPVHHDTGGRSRGHGMVSLCRYVHYDLYGLYYCTCSTLRMGRGTSLRRWSGNRRARRICRYRTHILRTIEHGNKFVVGNLYEIHAKEEAKYASVAVTRGTESAERQPDTTE